MQAEMASIWGQNVLFLGCFFGLVSPPPHSKASVGGFLTPSSPLLMVEPNPLFLQHKRVIFGWFCPVFPIYNPHEYQLPKNVCLLPKAQAFSHFLAPKA